MQRLFRISAALVIVAQSFAPVAFASEDNLVPSPAPTPRQMGMTGKFLVQAENGVIQFRQRGGRWSHTTVAVTGPELVAKVEDARLGGQPIIDLSHYDLISAVRRVESMRLLDGESFSALAMMVALRLDQPLANGEYRYVLISDDTHHVLLDRAGKGDRIRLSTYVRIPGETQASFLKHRKLPEGKGYAMSVPELTKSRAGAEYLLERLENLGVAHSVILESIVKARVG